MLILRNILYVCAAFVFAAYPAYLVFVFGASFRYRHDRHQMPETTRRWISRFRFITNAHVMLLFALAILISVINTFFLK